MYDHHDSSRRAKTGNPTSHGLSLAHHWRMGYGHTPKINPNDGFPIFVDQYDQFHISCWLKSHKISISIQFDTGESQLRSVVESA